MELVLRHPVTGLRDNSDGRWDRVVEASRSRVLSVMKTSLLDAYLLSESSLFVWDDRVLMITCGRTTLIRALPVILSFVREADVAHLFYERKNLMYPKDQPSDFEREVSYLETFFPGKSYRLGPANHDHVHVFYSSSEDQAPEKDATMEILMHEIDPGALSVFTKDGGRTPADAYRDSGMKAILPEMESDAFLFDPVGFSVNGISGDDYMTVHVTPQPSGSYASFETNVIPKDYVEMAARVLQVFAPGRFSIVLTRSLEEGGLGGLLPQKISHYRQVEKSLYEFDNGYAILFTNHSL